LSEKATGIGSILDFATQKIMLLSVRVNGEKRGKAGIY
jgi:hypothetical protein